MTERTPTPASRSSVAEEERLRRMMHAAVDARRAAAAHPQAWWLS